MSASERGSHYCDKDDVLNYLKSIDVEDESTTPDEINDLIGRWSEDIERQTKRKFYIVTASERYSGEGQQNLVLHNFPLISVSRVRIYNYNNQLCRDMNPPVENTDLIIDRQNGIITIPPAVTLTYPNPTSMMYWPYSSYGGAKVSGTVYDYINRFGLGTMNILIDYIYGFESTPEPIRDACIKLVCVELLRKHGSSESQGVASESIAGSTTTFAQRGGAGGSGAYAYHIDEMKADVKQTLRNWTKRRLLSV